MTNNKIALHYGAGSIGRGFIGHLLFESGYKTWFADVVEPVINKLKADKQYPLFLIDGENIKRIDIKNVDGVFSTEQDQVNDIIEQASWISTAVGNRILPIIAKSIAAGIKVRALKNINSYVNIVICENLYNAGAYLKDLIEKELDDTEKKYLNEYVGFVDTVIARMVPIFEPDFLKDNPVNTKAEPYRVLPVAREGFKGPIPQILGMIPVDDFSRYTERKLFIHNCGHATCAYLGAQKGYQYTWEAISDPEIYQKAYFVLERIAVALNKKFGLDPVGLTENIFDLLDRFNNSGLKDTVARVARDPMRKLARKDRLIGAALLYLDVIGEDGIESILEVIHAVLSYSNPEDEFAVQLQTLKKEKRIEAVLKEVCSLEEDEKLFRLIVDYCREKR